MPHTQTSISLERKYGVSFLDRQLVEFVKAAGTLEKFAEPFYYFYNDDGMFTLLNPGPMKLRGSCHLHI